MVRIRTVAKIAIIAKVIKSSIKAKASLARLARLDARQDARQVLPRLASTRGVVF
jgi:hypothetical protein